MGVRFACHGCGKGLNIKTELAGKRGKCPDCGLRFRIPLEDQALSIPLEDQSKDAVDASEHHSPDPPSSEQHSSEQHSSQQHSPDPPSSEQHSPEQHSSQQPSSEPVASEPVAAEPKRLDRVNESAGESAEFNPLEESDVAWYVRPPTGGRYGPATGPTVLGWIDEGRVTGDTLLWRDGWPQWRECQEVIPGLLAASPAAALSPAATIPPAARPLGQSPAETRAPVKTGPRADLGGQADSQQSGAGAVGQLGKTKARSTSRREKARQFSAAGGYDADSYLLTKKRQKAKQRMMAISVLIILSVVLVVALIAALLWERDPPPEETIGWRSLGVTSLLA
ncbi:hypothetical protein SH139x_001242 [Planctomycetaceae bacterium SH139]